MFGTKKEKLEKEKLKQELENADAELNPKDSGLEKEDAVKDTESEDSATEVSADAETNDETADLKKIAAEVSKLKDQLLRKAAEFENYKRRTENEVANIYRYASENLLTEQLPVLDDFERLMKNWNDKQDIEIVKKGIDLIYGKFRKTLEAQGLKEIDAAGKKFDVNMHDALMQIENNDLDDQTITEEVEKGYMLKDKVIRHSKVVVSKKSE